MGVPINFCKKLLYFVLVLFLTISFIITSHIPI
jgi:hypothetical protein